MNEVFQILLQREFLIRNITFSRFKEEDVEMDGVETTFEPSTAEHQSLYPADPECSSVGAELIASRLCLCTRKTEIYAAASNDGIPLQNK